MEDTKELVELVQDINMEIFNLEISEDFYFGVTLNTDGFSSAIDFMDCQIWSSENDEREYVKVEVDGKVDEELEPLRPFLLKKMSFVISQIIKIKDALENLSQ